MALDFDFDKLDQAISEIMGDVDDSKSTRAIRNNSEMPTRVQKTTPNADKTVAMTVNSRPVNNHRPKAAMIGGKVTNKLSQKPASSQKPSKSAYARPGSGRFLDMVSPSSDALNQHKPSVGASERQPLVAGETTNDIKVAPMVTSNQLKVAPRHTPQTAHRANRHELSQPLPETPGESASVSTADKHEPYLSPFLPQASELVKKRPLGARSAHGANVVHQQTMVSGRGENNRYESNRVPTRHGDKASLGELTTKSKKKSKAKQIAIRAVVFVGVIIIGGILGILCFYLFG